MTAPKSPLPGQFVELSRRTAHRRFLLRPGKDSRELTGYFYAKALRDTDQGASVACCMSGHLHTAQLDRSGRRSEFMQRFHSNLARKRNLQIGHREHFWAPGPPGDMVVIGDVDDIIRRVLYVCLQPVAAGCVERVEEWTGFQILPRHWGKPMRFERPDLCGPDMPEYVEFVPMPPPGFDHLPLKEVIAYFNHLIGLEERRYAKKRKRASVLGIAYCEALSPFHTPGTPSPMRGLNPRFTCQNKLKVIQALRRQRQFRLEHRAALTRFRGGDRSVVFPAGTLQMARLAGVACAPPGADDPRMTRIAWSAEFREQWTDWLRRRRRA